MSRIKSSGLARLVSHRELILPQLAGPGVAAHEVKRLSGFKVIYGPIRAKDLPTFLDAGLKASPEMRIKTFTTRERVVLVPIELVAAIKEGVLLLVILTLISFIARMGGDRSIILNQVLRSGQAIGMAILAGAVLTPILLPWIPGKAFSIKGGSIGGLLAFLFLSLRWTEMVSLTGQMERVAWLLLIPTLSAFLAMNFTGSSTFTSLSGVKKEIRWALPFQVGAGIVGLILYFGSQFIR